MVNNIDAIIMASKIRKDRTIDVSPQTGPPNDQEFDKSPFSINVLLLLVISYQCIFCNFPVE